MSCLVDELSCSLLKKDLHQKAVIIFHFSFALFVLFIIDCYVVCLHINNYSQWTAQQMGSLSTVCVSHYENTPIQIHVI